MSEPQPITYGTAIRLRHCETKRLLKSLDKVYSHPGTSGQQMVVAWSDLDRSTLWLVEGSNEAGGAVTPGIPVKRGDVIRLQHLTTKKHLHSHPNFPAPVTSSQQEVTAYVNDQGGGDFHDNWIVEPASGDTWMMDQPVVLVHQKTKKTLHSHHPASHPVYTTGNQEVTAFGGPRDINDPWFCKREDQPSPEKLLSQFGLRQSRWPTWLSIIGSIASITGWTVFTLKETLAKTTFVSVIAYFIACTAILGLLLLITSWVMMGYRNWTRDPKPMLFKPAIWLLALAIGVLAFLVIWRIFAWVADNGLVPVLKWALGVSG